MQSIETKGRRPAGSSVPRLAINRAAQPSELSFHRELLWAVSSVNTSTTRGEAGLQAAV